MAPTTLSVTLTAHITPPLDETTAPATGADLAARLGAAGAATALGHDDDTGWASWTLVLTTGQHLGDVGPDLWAALDEALPASHTVRPIGLEVLTMDEVNRRIASRGRAPGIRRPAGGEVPPIPEVVTTTQFAALCRLTPQRIRQLRQERAEGKAEGFPAEFIPGHWLTTEAKAYAAARPA